jgi:hypothetical protein
MWRAWVAKGAPPAPLSAGDVDLTLALVLACAFVVLVLAALRRC